MIVAYNRLQIFKGIFLILASIICYGLAWLFFKYGLTLVFHNLAVSVTWVPWLSLAALAAITWGGYRQWQKGDGFNSYVESSLFHDQEGDSGGEFLVHHYAHRVTAPAYMLSQIFLGGPLLFLRGMKHLKQRLPNEAGMEVKLYHALSVLQAANKWQPITEHPDLRLEILMLAQMGKIDFSAHKGIPRIKATPPDGI